MKLSNNPNWLKKMEDDDGGCVSAGELFAKKFVHIQGLGDFLGTPAAELRVGDAIMWNYGHKSQIIKIENISPCFISVDVVNENGLHFNRRLKKTRLVAKVDPFLPA